ncbi:squalene monooxygenase [Pseudohyphozyma bogoriensis]|nr:squalene monooxygenase [Pseudohyphozyma bogoriensis]
MTAAPIHPAIVPANADVAAKQTYDVLIIGAGIIGSCLAYSLATSGRSVLLLERDLAEPDRIVGELLQPGGCMALRKLGIDDVLEGCDAVKVEGYKVFWGPEAVDIPYPEEKVEMGWSEGGVGSGERVQEGRSFHHGRFVQNLRRKAASTKGVTLVQAAVNSLRKDGLGTIIGATATVKDGDDRRSLDFSATLTFISDGFASSFRREILPSHVSPIVRSNFIGLVLNDADLPAPNHGHVILGKSLPTDTSSSPIGPVLVYQLSANPSETRMLVDVRGSKIPVSNKELPSFLTKHVTPVLPSSIVPSFTDAMSRAQSGSSSDRLRSMPNSYLAPYPQGRGAQGAILCGDSLNMRHPLTGGGMTVAFNDCVILTELLGGGNVVGEVKGEGGVVDLSHWEEVTEKLDIWHWRRKGVATCINVLAMALYSLFGADDENLEVLKTGCFKYFELGGECVNGPVSLLSAITPSPLLLFYHFFSVAFYSLYILFTDPLGNGSRPKVTQYPALGVKSAKVFWTACVTLLPFLWKEGQM